MAALFSSVVDVGRKLISEPAEFQLRAWLFLKRMNADDPPSQRAGSSSPSAFKALGSSHHEPLGIAELWSSWRPQTGGEWIETLTMMTINADAHALMRNMHRPNEEKRMVVILPDDQYDAWLKASAGESGWFLRQYPAELLDAKPAPKKPKKATGTSDILAR